MKYYRWLPLAIIFLSTSAHSLQSTVEIFEQFDDLKMIAFISEQHIKDNPEWNPDTGAPPLTVLQAIKAVRGFSKSSNISGAIKEIELRPVPKNGNHWHYLVKVENNATKAKCDIFLVLMSGEVIPAIIEPQAYK